MTATAADTTSTTLDSAIATLTAGQTLSEAESYAVFSAIMNGEASGDLGTAQIADFLRLLALRTPTVDELVGAARVMRQYVLPVPVSPSDRAQLLDTCGTGGAAKTFNVSTAAAIITAAAIRRGGRNGGGVAKHGNRSRTGRGSAEVLERLGVNINATPAQQSKCLSETGLCFCFAVNHHPAIRHAMPARRALGTPTIFNLLGPLTNPAGAPRQLIGVYEPRYIEPLAHALARLGSARALVVHGTAPNNIGLDEMATTGPTRFASVCNGSVTTGTLDPGSLGLQPASLGDLTAVDLEESAGLVLSCLAPRGQTRSVNFATASISPDSDGGGGTTSTSTSGGFDHDDDHDTDTTDPSPAPAPAPAPPPAPPPPPLPPPPPPPSGNAATAAREMALLNAAAALTLTDLAEDFSSALAIASEAVDSGAAAETLSRLVAISWRPA